MLGLGLIYSCDLEGRPSSIGTSVTQGSTVLTYLYDADGRRLKKTENGQTTVYIGGNYERNVTSGQTTTYYAALGQPVAMRTGAAGNTILTWLYRDHLGSTIASSGGGTSTTSYWPYGSQRSLSGSLPTDRRYTGQRLDTAVGLYDYGARSYDPATGRFVQPDTLVSSRFDPQSLNRYAYVRNSPLNFSDPTGHMQCLDDCGVGGTGGGGDPHYTYESSESGGDYHYDIGTWWTSVVERIGLGPGGFDPRPAPFGPLPPPIPLPVPGLPLPPGAGAASPVAAKGSRTPTPEPGTATPGSGTAGESGGTSTPQPGVPGTQTPGTTPTSLLTPPSTFTPDQDAVIQLAKEAKRVGRPLTNDEADALLDLARQTGLDRVAGVRDDRGTTHWQGTDAGVQDHIHIGPVDHIPVQ